MKVRMAVGAMGAGFLCSSFTHSLILIVLAMVLGGVIAYNARRDGPDR